MGDAKESSPFQMEFRLTSSDFLKNVNNCKCSFI